jgi:beta-lactam-binding protein with PASTA domain
MRKVDMDCEIDRDLSNNEKIVEKCIVKERTKIGTREGRVSMVIDRHSGNVIPYEHENVSSDNVEEAVKRAKKKFFR